MVDEKYMFKKIVDTSFKGMDVIGSDILSEIFFDKLGCSIDSGVIKDKIKMTDANSEAVLISSGYSSVDEPIKFIIDTVNFWMFFDYDDSVLINLKDKYLFKVYADSYAVAEISDLSATQFSHIIMNTIAWDWEVKNPIVNMRDFLFKIVNRDEQFLKEIEEQRKNEFRVNGVISYFCNNDNEASLRMQAIIQEIEEKYGDMVSHYHCFLDKSIMLDFYNDDISFRFVIDSDNNALMNVGLGNVVYRFENFVISKHDSIFSKITIRCDEQKIVLNETPDGDYTFVSKEHIDWCLERGLDPNEFAKKESFSFTKINELIDFGIKEFNDECYFLRTLNNKGKFE